MATGGEGANGTKGETRKNLSPEKQRLWFKGFLFSSITVACKHSTCTAVDSGGTWSP